MSEPTLLVSRIRNLKSSLSGKTKDIVRSLAAKQATDKVGGRLLRFSERTLRRVGLQLLVV
jgi:hypothetical protein